jgi:PAS domain-containing protein
MACDIRSGADGSNRAAGTPARSLCSRPLARAAVRLHRRLCRLALRLRLRHGKCGPYSATAERLSAALDQVDIGIVLLDAETRAEFINRAFREYFSPPDEKAESWPPFIVLMYHSRDTGRVRIACG